MKKKNKQKCWKNRLISNQIQNQSISLGKRDCDSWTQHPEPSAWIHQIWMEAGMSVASENEVCLAQCSYWSLETQVDKDTKQSLKRRDLLTKETVGGLSRRKLLYNGLDVRAVV